MQLNELTKESHERAVRKGWWGTAEDQSVAVKIALMHSELSEALEEYRRDGDEPTIIWFTGSYPTDRSKWYDFCAAGNKPEGLAIELADCIIRICDLAGRLGIDLEDAITLKSLYNETRAQRHGGKKI